MTLSYAALGEWISFQDTQFGRICFTLLLKRGILKNFKRLCSRWRKVYAFYLFMLRFYSPVNQTGSCWARSAYLTTPLLGRLSPLSGYPVLCTFPFDMGFCGQENKPEVTIVSSLQRMAERLFSDDTDRIDISLFVNINWKSSLATHITEPYDKTNKMACAPCEDTDQP